MDAERSSDDGFVAFFRSYTKTWVHAVSTAGLTAFGLLTFVNRWFVVLALAAYVVPPAALYLAHGADAADVVEGRRGSEADGGELGAGTGASVDGSESGVAGSPERETTERETSANAERNSSDAAADDDPAAEATSNDDPTDEATADEERTPAEDAEAPREWTRTDAPTDEDLHGVAITAAGACAVGDGGVALAGDEDGWTVAMAEGPAAEGNDLTGVDATADGAAVWVAGDSGALARIDAETWRHTDYTAPADITDNWTGVGVGGAAGEETIVLVNGSGQVLRGEFGDDGPSWSDPIKPGGGSSISAVDQADASLGHCCDTNDGVFETTDGARSFECVGVDGANGTLTDVAGAARGDCLATDDDGVVHRYDGRTWTPDRLHDDELAGVARWEDLAIVCGEDAVFERQTPTGGWDHNEFEDAALYGVDVRGERAVAVGENGSVVTRGGIGDPAGAR